MNVRVCVFGGTSGIGEACVTLLENDDDIDIYASGVEIDVRNSKVVDSYLHDCEPNLIVYSAGINQLMWDSDMMTAYVKDMFDINVFGFMRVIRYAAITSTVKSIVAISSDAATRPMRTSMAYCASKAALNSCVKQAARELAPHIRVNAVSPGIIAPTGMSDYIDATVPVIRGWSKEKASEYELSQIPIGRRGTPEEVASVVRDVLLGPEYLTGAIVEVNGGR